jgi:leucine-zipper of insertion element IS481
MNIHKNAGLTVSGRGLLVDRVARGWGVGAAGTSRRTAHKWLGRHRCGGERSRHDRSSAPRRCPRRAPPERAPHPNPAHTPRTNGKAECFIWTSLREWADIFSTHASESTRMDISIYPGGGARAIP